MSTSRLSEYSSGLDISPPNVIAEFRNGLDPKISSVLTERECTRFINARPKSMKKACEMATTWYEYDYLNYIFSLIIFMRRYEWRHSLLKPFAPSNIQYTPNVILLCPDQPYDQPHIHLTPVCHNGFDKEGSPIYWERTGLIQSNFGEVKKHFTADQLVLYHIQSQEVAMMRLAYASRVFGREVHQMTAVFDMKHLTMSLDMECIYYIKAILDIDQAFYPECLKTLFIINCPWYFTGIYSMFKPFIDKKTASKFQLLGSNYLPTLEKYIDREYIPVELGGDHENYPWLQFAPNSGATENDLIEHLLRTYNPMTISKLLTGAEMDLLQEAIETRGQRLLIPSDVKYTVTEFPTLTADQLHQLSAYKPKNCYEAFLVLVTVPDFVIYTKEVFPSLTDDQLSLLTNEKPKTLHRICELIQCQSLYKSGLNLQTVMNWLLPTTHTQDRPEFAADRPELVAQMKDQYDLITQGVIAMYFYAIRRKNEPSSSSTRQENVGLVVPMDDLATKDEVPPGQFLSLDGDEAFDDLSTGSNFLIATGSGNSKSRRSSGESSPGSPIRRSDSMGSIDSMNRKVTWAQAAGRPTGPSDYQLGDLTKTVMRKVVGGKTFSGQSSSKLGVGVTDCNSNSVSVVTFMKTSIMSTEVMTLLL